MSERRRIKLVTDPVRGWPHTKVLDAQTGEWIPGVRKATFHTNYPGDVPTVEVECLFAEVEVVGDLTAIEVTTTKGERRRFEFPAGAREVPVEDVAPTAPTDVTEIGEQFRRTVPR